MSNKPLLTAVRSSAVLHAGLCMMAHQLLKENPDPSEEDIRHYFSGNLCRCAAYPEIIEAVQRAAKG